MLELNCLYHMDCMDGMAQFPDKFFDLAIVDPPYGLNIQNMGFCKSGAKRIGKAVRRDYSDTPAWDASAPGENYFSELFRVSNLQIIWGGNYFSDILPPSKSFVCWDKKTDEKYSNDFADCEYAWCSPQLGVARVFRYMWNGMLQQNMKQKEERIHPTQKPIALYKWLLTKYARKGDIILDTHVGSASSLIACHDLHFDFVGFELDETYFKKAQERMQQHFAQLTLF